MLFGIVQRRIIGRGDAVARAAQDATVCDTPDALQISMHRRWPRGGPRTRTRNDRDRGRGLTIRASSSAATRCPAVDASLSTHTPTSAA